MFKIKNWSRMEAGSWKLDVSRHFMKIAIQIFFFILIPLNIFAQTENINSGKYYPAKDIFEKEYKKSEYLKFDKSQIIAGSNKVILNVIKSIEFNENSDEKTKLILKAGLLDPYVINGSFSLKIGWIDELTLLNPNPQTKRFKFWIFYTGNKNPLLNSVNPHEYYFELYNKNANENSSFENFVNDANLTFLIGGGIIL